MYNSTSLLPQLNNGCQISGILSSSSRALGVLCYWGCRGVEGGLSVKGLGRQAWIVCSGCCLPAMADFPILLWRWIKHDFAGEEPWGRGAQVTRPAEGPGEVYVVNPSLMETLTLLSLLPTIPHTKLIFFHPHISIDEILLKKLKTTFCADLLLFASVSRSNLHLSSGCSKQTTSTSITKA